MTNIFRSIAIELDLHESTVKKALLGMPGVAEKTKELVFECARERGYEPPAPTEPRPEYPRVEPAPFVERNTMHETLLHTLGPEGFLLLVEKYGGFRLYVPSDPHRSELPADITIQHATTLSAAFGGEYLRVPLAREFRARQYARDGLSHRGIAQKLGMTEVGVQRLVSRLRKENDDLG